MKLEKALKRDRKRQKRQHGMRVSGKSVLLLETMPERTPKKAREKKQKGSRICPICGGEKSRKAELCEVCTSTIPTVPEL